MTFTRDSRRLMGAGYGGRIFTWNLANGQKDEILLPGQEYVHSLNFSPDGDLFAVGSSDSSGNKGGILVREQATGRDLYRIENRGRRVDVKNDRLLFHPAQCNYSLGIFAPDGKTLAAHTSDLPQVVRLCDSKTGAERQRIELGARLVRLAFSPDGRHIAATERDNAVRVYDTATGRRLHSWMLNLGDGFENYASVLAFSPDGKLLAAGATDHLVHLWDMSTKKEVRTFKGHTGTVTGLAVEAESKTLISASADGTIRRWDTATGREQSSTEGYSGDVLVAYSPDAKYIASAGGADVHLRDAATGKKLRVLTGKASGATSLAFASNGRLLAAGGSLNSLLHRH